MFLAFGTWHLRYFLCFFGGFKSGKVKDNLLIFMTKIKKTQTDTNNLPNKHSMEKGLSVCVTDLVALAHSMQFIKIHVSAAWTKNIATFRSDKQAKNDSINWPLHVKIKGVQHKLQELMNRIPKHRRLGWPWSSFSLKHHLLTPSSGEKIFRFIFTLRAKCRDVTIQLKAL